MSEELISPLYKYKLADIPGRDEMELLKWLDQEFIDGWEVCAISPKDIRRWLFKRIH